MEYEWNESKNTTNAKKHGISFAAIYEAEWEKAIVISDTRKDYGESRYLAYVPIDNRLHVVIYVERENARRIISLRKANLRERNHYDCR